MICLIASGLSTLEARGSRFTTWSIETLVFISPPIAFASAGMSAGDSSFAF